MRTPFIVAAISCVIATIFSATGNFIPKPQNERASAHYQHNEYTVSRMGAYRQTAENETQGTSNESPQTNTTAEWALVIVGIFTFFAIYYQA